MKIKQLLNEKNSETNFAVFKCIQNFLKPLLLTQKSLESNQPNSHTLYKLVNETLVSYLNCDIYDNYIESLSISIQNEVKAIVEVFRTAINTKWNETYLRNCDKTIFGKNGFLNKLMVFDSFIKSQLNNDFNFYFDIFNHLLPIELKDLKTEFNSYV